MTASGDGPAVQWYHGASMRARAGKPSCSRPDALCPSARGTRGREPFPESTVRSSSWKGGVPWTRSGTSGTGAARFPAITSPGSSEQVPRCRQEPKQHSHRPSSRKRAGTAGRCASTSSAFLPMPGSAIDSGRRCATTGSRRFPSPRTTAIPSSRSSEGGTTHPTSHHSARACGRTSARSRSTPSSSGRFGTPPIRRG